MRGRHLQRARAKLFSEEPTCRPCRERGLVRLAEYRDHIVPLAEGGKDAEDNTQPICGDCHQSKTQAEAKRGQWRHYRARAEG